MASKPSSIYAFNAIDIDGNDVSLEKYRGKVCIIFNGACKCGLTEKNYTQLQQMYQEFGDSHGLQVLGFPSNQFGGQEPWPEEEVKKFVVDKFNVTFDMFSKVDVNGKDTHPLFKYLKQAKGGSFGDFLKWNFTKFIIDKEGVPQMRYAPTTEPNEMRKDLAKYF